MPVPPPALPYDTAEYILNFARVIANDCAIALAGNLLSDAQPYTYTMLNLAWRKLQDRLGNCSIESFPSEAVITVPAIPASIVDPAAQPYMAFNGFYNGTGLLPGPVLPGDLEIPLKLWERPTGQNALFIQMYPTSSGLPNSVRSSSLRVWEWRDDQLFFVGANQATDIRLRYKKSLPDTVDATTKVPLLRCAVALAYLTVEVFTATRGGTVTQIFSSEKEDAIKQLVNNTARKKQGENVRRIPYSRRSRVGW